MKYHGIFGDNYRGHLAGMVGTRGAYGAVLRTRVTPTNPQTPAQLLVQSVFKTTSAAWNLLTPIQMEAWRELGRETKRTDSQGDKYRLTGINMYKSVNQPLLTVGESAIATPPASLDVRGVTAFYAGVPITIATTTLAMEFTPEPLTANEKLIVSVVENVSAGINNVASRYHRLGISAISQATPFTVTLEQTPIVGRRYWFRAVILNLTNGQTSTPVETSEVVA